MPTGLSSVSNGGTHWRQRFDLHTVVVERDVALLTHRGTHGGAWRGTAPTDRQIVVEAMMCFDAGRIVEVWEVTDEHADRQHQMGRER